MEIQLWFLFAAAITVASISPGPNVLNVIVNTVRFGFAGALYTILGNLVCLFCVAVLAAVGVGAIVATMPVAFTAMKIAGGMYLAWLGFKMIRASFGCQAQIRIDEGVSVNEKASPLALLGQAYLVSASNPKSILFLSAVFPHFLNTEAPIVPQFAIMFATIIGLVCVIHGFYAAMASAFRNKPVSVRMRRWMSRVTGTTFIGLGAGVALSK